MFLKFFYLTFLTTKDERQYHLTKRCPVRRVVAVGLLYLFYTKFLNQIFVVSRGPVVSIIPLRFKISSSLCFAQPEVLELVSSTVPHIFDSSLLISSTVWMFQTLWFFTTIPWRSFLLRTICRVQKVT